MDILLYSMDDHLEPSRKRSRLDPDIDPLTLSYAAVSSSYCDRYDEDDDKESVHSWQSAETAIVCDSGDDWMPSGEEEEDAFSEFELLEDESSRDGQHESDSSSSLSDVLNIPVVLTDRDHQQNYWDGNSNFGDLSCWESSVDGFAGSDKKNDSVLSESAKLQWNCLGCKETTTAPRRFCFSCSQKRKCGLPPRPVRRRMRKPARKKDESGPAMSPSSSTAVAAPNSASSSILGVGPPSVNHTATPATVGIGSPVESNTCSICQGVRDGAFVHGRRAHVVYCFSCTERISRKPGARCPICRLTIQKSLKLFIS